MKTCSILVVDDEPDIRDLLGRMLKASGHEVVCVGNGLEAAKAMTQQPIDVVLTDLLMPDKDGIELITELKRKYPAVRIVAMSGGGHVPRGQYLHLAKGLGAHALLAKPFERQELLDVIESVQTGAA
jgi:CheY-like chemotaxis protein